MAHSIPAARIKEIADVAIPRLVEPGNVRQRAFSVVVPDLNRRVRDDPVDLAEVLPGPDLLTPVPEVLSKNGGKENRMTVRRKA